jgi:2-polyprenyl-3-methyl-5-hydroxy-6-metoxy-1,4-benzoquinol methylase
MTTLCPQCETSANILAPEIRDEHVMKGRGDVFSVVHCQTCETAFSFPILGVKELAFYYPDEYSPYNSLGGLKGILTRIKYRAEAKAIARLKRSGNSLFEIGAGRGEFLVAARAEGFQVGGVEPSSHACQVAKKEFSLNLANTFAESFIFDRAHDVVVMRHCLEHCIDPQCVLKRIFVSGLNPGGWIVLKLPLLNTWERNVFGAYWSGWDMPRHRTHFTSKGIQKSLEAQGFCNVKVIREIVPNDVDYSLQYLARSGNLVAKSFRAILKLFPSIFSTITFQMFALALSPLGAGRAIVYAQKPSR